MTGSEKYSSLGSLDDVLALAATLAWVLLTFYAAGVFIRAWRQRGLRSAVIRLFSYRVLGPFTVALSIALVFVQPPYVAVVVSILSPGGIRPQPLRAGLHWIIPFFERSAVYPIYWQAYTMSGRPTEGEKLGDDSIRARTSDGQEVRMDVSLIFRVDSEQAVTIHIDWQDRYVEELVRPVTRGIVRTQVSEYTVREVNSEKRKGLEVALDQILREQLGDKGLILDQFLLRDITFPQEFSNAIEKKQVALEGIEEKEHEANQIRNLAKGQADAIEIKAQAQAQALKLIAEALREDPNLLTYRYIEKLSPNIRAMLVPTQTPLILPLPDVLGENVRTAAETGAAGVADVSPSPAAAGAGN